MKLVVCNFKMNLNASDINEYLKEVKVDNNNFVVCPTSLYIPYFLNNKYKVGIQNVYYEDKGAYTGEVSPSQAYSMGVNYVILGHSERREIFKENNSLINLKINGCLKNNLKVILCIGESLTEKSMHKTKEVLKKQLKECLKDIKEEVIVAYEPIWSIGTNKTPTKKEIEETINYIKEVVIDLTDINPKVLYGGSVNEKNIVTLNKINNIDGFLIGGASIKIDSINKIIKEVL